MTREEIDELVAQYAKTEGIQSSMEIWNSYGPGSQYDDDSANINYSLVRHFKPTAVLEFGTRTARCTHDIMLALMRNGNPFVFKAYELEDDLRDVSQKVIDLYFGDNIIKIGSDVMRDRDIPDGLDYVFIDNYHDLGTTKWVFEELLPKCKPGALVHFHDLRIREENGKWLTDGGGFPDEPRLVIENAKYNGGPLEKLYFSWENGEQWESAWFIYNP